MAEPRLHLLLFVKVSPKFKDSFWVSRLPGLCFFGLPELGFSVFFFMLEAFGFFETAFLVFLPAGFFKTVDLIFPPGFFKTFDMIFPPGFFKTFRLESLRSLFSAFAGIWSKKKLGTSGRSCSFKGAVLGQEVKLPKLISMAFSTGAAHAPIRLTG